jgi:putative transposase
MKPYFTKADIAQSYPTDLTDEQWKRLEPCLPSAKPGGRPRTVDLRGVTNAILYLERAGCAWRLLPHDFPPWQTVYTYFRKWKLDGTWDRIHDIFCRSVRLLSGRKEQPSAGILDSQSVKTAGKAEDKGYDAGKKVSGRKRHLLVDTLGLIIAVVVHSAGVQDYDGARPILEKIPKTRPRLKLIWADYVYRPLIDWFKSHCGRILEIVRRPANAKGFQVQPRRWIVERTFAWLGRYRRHSKDYETLTASSEAHIKIAMINLMLKRITNQRLTWSTKNNF